MIGSDLSIASAEQMAARPDGHVYFDGPPILAVEILEPWDTQGDIVGRVKEYLAAGPVVREVDHDFRRVSVHRPGDQGETLVASQELSADPYQPGFRVAVAAIFDD